MRGLCRVFPARVFPGYRVEYRVTPHPDAGSSKVPLVGIAFAGIPWIPHQVRNDVKHRVKARYDVAVTPHSDAGSRKVPLVGIAFASIPGFRIKCGMTGRVFLDTAS